MPHRPPDLANDRLEEYLSADRLRPFFLAANESRDAALQLYRLNVELSGAVYESLHRVEVVLRNGMDRELRRWNATQRLAGRPRSADWLMDTSQLLWRLVQGRNVLRARERARKVAELQRRVVRHSDVLAQLQFGTWRYLLPTLDDDGRRYLWDEALHRAFPYLQAGPDELTEMIVGLHTLRNRVAHLEPLLRWWSVGHQYDNMVQILRAMDPVVAEWLVESQRVTGCLKLMSQVSRGPSH